MSTVIIYKNTHSYGFRYTIKKAQLRFDTAVAVLNIFANLLKEASENASYNLFAEFSADGICSAVDSLFKYALLLSA